MTHLIVPQTNTSQNIDDRIKRFNSILEKTGRPDLIKNALLQAVRTVMEYEGPSQIEEFLRSVWPDVPGGFYCLGTRPPGGKMRLHWFKSVGEAIAEAEKLKDAEKDVYYAVPAFSSQSKTQAAAISCKVFLLDADVGEGKAYSSQFEAFEAICTFADRLGVHPVIVNSGNGLQALFLMDSPIPKEEWDKTASNLASAYKTGGIKDDPSRTQDISSLMRLPDTLNHRNPANPKKTGVSLYGEPISLQEFQKGLSRVTQFAPEAAARLSEIPASPRVQKADANDDFLPPPNPESQENVERVKSALFTIPGFDDRAPWLKVGMMLHSTGWDSAFDLWTQWSKQSGKYDEADQRRVWQSFHEDGGVSIGTLFHMAKENGWVEEAQSGCGVVAGANGLQFSEVLRDGRPKLTHANVMAAVSHKYTGRVRQNTFSYKLELDGCPIDDTDYARIMVDLSEAYGLNAPKGLVADFVGLLAQDASYHPVQEYLTRLHWDGKDRIGKLFDDYFVTEPSGYCTRVAKIFLIGAVARAMRPGCKVDTMLILEGRQGLNKSTGLRALFGADWFVEVLSSPDSKDFFTDIQGAWCVEFAELSQMKGVRDARRLKQVITQQSDTFTPKYERTARTFPRQCVFTGTTNESEYLGDPTGARRFLPVELKSVDVEKITQDRDQIWAQAVRLFDQGADFWTLPEGHDGVVAEKYETDAWESRVLEEIDRAKKADPSKRITAELLFQGIGLMTSNVGRPEQTRLGNIMRRLGYKKVREAGGMRQYFYQKE